MTNGLNDVLQINEPDISNTLSRSGPSRTDAVMWAVAAACRTCMPQTLTPSVAEVLCSHFFICRAAFSSEASSPCCLVPIFRSRMQGYEKWWTTFSSSRNSGWNTAVKEQHFCWTSEPPVSKGAFTVNFKNYTQNTNNAFWCTTSTILMWHNEF